MRKQIAILLIVLNFTSCNDRSDIVSSVKFEDKYGFIDQAGEWVIRPSFDSVGTFYDGYADFYTDNKNGIINNRGQVIIEAKFDFIGHFSDNRALVLKNDKFNFIDKKGQTILNSFFEDAEDFSEGLAAIQFKKDGKWGYIDTIGNLVIDTSYDYGNEFTKGIAEVDKGELTLSIDKNGNVIDRIPDLSENEQYKLIGSSNSGTLGKLSALGDTIMKPEYISFGHEQNDIFWYNKDNLYGLADTQGNILIEPKFQFLSSFSDNGLAIAKLNDKYGYIDTRGYNVIDYQYENAEGFKFDLAAVKINEKWGFINIDNEFVIEPIFENVSHQFRRMSAKREPMYKYTNE